MGSGALVPGSETLGPQVGMPLSQQQQEAAKDEEKEMEARHSSQSQRCERVCKTLWAQRSDYGLAKLGCTRVGEVDAQYTGQRLQS